MLWIKLVDSELLTFFSFLCRYIQQDKQIQQVNRLLTLKTEQEWSSGKHLLPFPRPGRGLPVLPTMAFMERLRRKGVPFSCFWYMKWYEFVVGFLPLREVFCLGSPIFPPPKTNLSKVQFDPEQTDAYKFLATSKCSVGKQITNYQFICLFF